MVRVLVQERGRKFHFQRLVLQQIDQRSGLNRQRTQQLGGGRAQLAPALLLVGVGLGILHQRGSDMDLPQKHLSARSIGELGRSLLNLLHHGLGTRLVHVVCGLRAPLSSVIRPAAALPHACPTTAATPGSPACARSQSVPATCWSPAATDSATDRTPAPSAFARRHPASSPRAWECAACR